MRGGRQTLASNASSESTSAGLASGEEMWRGARPSRTTLDSAKTLIRPVAPGNRDLKAGRLVAGVRERDRSARLEDIMSAALNKS